MSTIEHYGNQPKIPPDFYLHTLHLEFGQCVEKITHNTDSPFGVKGVNYDESYTVTMEPLYRKQQQPAFTIVTAEPVGYVVVKKWFEGSPRVAKLNPEYREGVRSNEIQNGDLLYLAPGPCSELALTVLEILHTAKDIPDGLYAKAKRLAAGGGK